MNDEERKQARTYAWAYFALHADQRMKLFSFFLVLSGLVLGAFPAVREIASGRIVALLPLLLVVVAFVFWRLDERTRTLVVNGEAALKSLDRQWSSDSDSVEEIHYLRLFERDDHVTNIIRKRWRAGYLIPISYSECFRVAYLMIGGTGILLGVWEGLR